MYQGCNSGADPGGAGVPGGQAPLPFWGTPKLHKHGKNVAHVCAKMPRFGTKQLPGPHLFKILYPPLLTRAICKVLLM